MSKALNEKTLPDDYPVHMGHVYVADGLPIVSDISGNVAALKQDVRATEIKNCDLVGRGFL